MDQERLLSSVATTCRRLDLGKSLVYELMKSGRLEAVKVGSKTLITERSIRAFVAEVTGAAKEAA